MNNRVFYISGPRRNMIPGYWLYDYLIDDGYSVVPFYERTTSEATHSKLFRAFRYLSISFSVLRHARKNDLVLVYDNDFAGYILSFLSVIFGSPFVVLKINQMGSTKGKLLSPHTQFVAKVGFKNMYTTCNNDELGDLFSQQLHIPRSHFITVPDSISDFGADIEQIEDRSDEGYIFMGGATQRDYHLFVECARHLPKYQFMAVTFESYKDYFINAPTNLKVIYNLPEKQFYEKIAHSSLVFVPLTGDLQGGQMVLFQAALLGKAIVTTENLAIHTYFDSSSVALIPIGNVEKAVDVLQSLMSNSETRKKRGTNAYKSIKRFTTEAIYRQYKEKLFPLSEIHHK